MDEKKINALELARLSGVGKSTIYGLLDMRDRTNFTADVLEDIAKSLQVPPSLMLIENAAFSTPDEYDKFLTLFCGLNAKNREKAVSYVDDLTKAQRIVTNDNK